MSASASASTSPNTSTSTSASANASTNTRHYHLYRGISANASANVSTSASATYEHKRHQCQCMSFISVTRKRLLGQGFEVVGVDPFTWEDGCKYDMVVLDRHGRIVPFVRHGTHRVAAVNLKPLRRGTRCKRYHGEETQQSPYDKVANGASPHLFHPRHGSQHSPTLRHLWLPISPMSSVEAWPTAAMGANTIAFESRRDTSRPSSNSLLDPPIIPMDRQRASPVHP